MCICGVKLWQDSNGCRHENDDKTTKKLRSYTTFLKLRMTKISRRLLSFISWHSTSIFPFRNFHFSNVFFHFNKKLSQHLHGRQWKTYVAQHSHRQNRYFPDSNKIKLPPTPHWKTWVYIMKFYVLYRITVF